ncbi:MAG: hypothetical protein IJ767_00985 [Bacteroidaceae bacterium]|nr:hypothetical protein [Bacteroidaceae bacterium]
MKKIIITALLALVAMVGQAQAIKTDYENILDSLPTVMQEYLTMQGVQHFRVTLTGEFNGRRAKMKRIACDNGKFDERGLMSDVIHLVFTDSIESLDFMAVPSGEDSLRIACFYPESGNYRLFEDKVKADKMKILMETLTPGNGPDYPVIAYSTGIPVNGGTWFCGLRDAGTEPRLWYEKHGINDYVYYTVTLEDDTPYNENDLFYVKISKQESLGIH